jgi:hypothetical protein
VSTHVTLDAKATNSVKKHGFNPEDVSLVLTRLGAVVPHIAFSDWTLFENQEPFDPNKPWAHRRDKEVHCHLFLTKGIHIVAKLFAVEEIRNSDLQLLSHMTQEAAKLLESSIKTIVSLSNFGMDAVSRTLASIANLPSEQIGSYLKFLRSISGETYENQRLAYGLILSRRQPQNTSAILEFDNKRFKRLTDGFSTALTLNKHGGISELTPLTVSKEQKNSRLGRPLWLAGLADTAHQKGGLGIALTKGGDILIVHKREILFSQRAGEWRIWRHKAILETIATLWQSFGNRAILPSVLASLYKAALDLSFRRTGGLLAPNASELRNG